MIFIFLFHKEKQFLSKPWFDLDCKFARKSYRKIKRRFKSRKTDLSHSELRDAEKKYKNLLNKKIKNYSQNMTKNLDELHSTNPKDFWKLLNKGKRKNQPDIGIDKLFAFFKDLNSDFYLKDFYISFQRRVALNVINRSF
jgi:hypothetical protein